MINELVRPVNYNPVISQKLIKLEISSHRFSQLECNEESDETEGYSALYTPLLPLKERICASKRLLLIERICSTLGIFFPLRVAPTRIGKRGPFGP